MGLVDRFVRRIVGLAPADSVTGAPEVSGDVQKECLSKGYKLIHALLLEEGSFPPFGNGITRAGEIKVCLSEDGHPETVTEWLCKGCAEGRFLEVYLWCMVDYWPEEEPSAKGRAMAVYIDHPGKRGTCRVIFTPYVIEDGNLSVGRADIRESEDRVLK